MHRAERRIAWLFQFGIIDRQNLRAPFLGRKGAAASASLNVHSNNNEKEKKKEGKKKRKEREMSALAIGTTDVRREIREIYERAIVARTQAYRSVTETERYRGRKPAIFRFVRRSEDFRKSSRTEGSNDGNTLLPVSNHCCMMLR